MNQWKKWIKIIQQLNHRETIIWRIELIGVSGNSKKKRKKLNAIGNRNEKMRK